MSQIALSVSELSYRWDEKREILSKISFELETGKVMGLLGPNGSGKSTLLKAIAGMLPRQRGLQVGQIYYRGKEATLFSPQKWAQSVAYIGSDIRTDFPLTVEEVVSLGRVSYGGGWFRRLKKEDQERIQWALNQCLCGDLRGRTIETLSGGERQRVAMARALAQGAQVLLVDETLSQMDLNYQYRIGCMLKELAHRGWAVLLVAHDVNLALEWIDSAIFIKEGKKIAQGSVEKVMNSELLSLLYPGVELTLGKSPTNQAPKIYFGKQNSDEFT